MNTYPASSEHLKKSSLKKRTAIAAGPLLLTAALVTGCSSGEANQGDTKSPSPSAQVGNITPVEPTLTAPTFVDRTPDSGSPSPSASHKTPKLTPSATKFSYTGENACPWTKQSPLPVNSIYTAMGGDAVTATMLDLRCADFPNLKFGTPKDGDITTKHFYAFKEPTTKSPAFDLNVAANLQPRGPYLSEYVGVCAVEGQDFTGTDGRRSDVWLKVIAARGQDVPQNQNSVYVPYAEGGYVEGTQFQPLNRC